ncbi:MAG TPA: tetratricopeptide repeat protein [Candidatus Obscuribacterales bacterium]
MISNQPALPLWKECANAALQAELRGSFDKAEQQYRLSLKFAEHSPITSDENIGEALINLADFLTSKGRYEEAEECYRRAIEIYDRLFASDNLISEMIYRVLAEIYNLQEQSVNAHLLNKRAAS